METLKNKIVELHKSGNTEKKDLLPVLDEFLNALNSGNIRAAEPLSDGSWQVNKWVKQGILLLFKSGALVDYSLSDEFKFFDKDTIPLKKISIENKIRLVPGGSSIRTGSYVAEGVICMPPMYINIGAFVDEGSMIDSHALVGTCGQVGKNVHLSAAAQVGGVLEPAGARPVIIEDDVLIGGNCGIYEGVRVKKRAVLASGVILTASTKVFDIVNNEVLASTPDEPLTIPENAVLVPGTRRIKSPFAEEHKLSISSPIIIKYRDEKTDGRVALEEALR